MAYTAWSVSFGEQPSAAKWNQLGSNDAHFYSFLGDNLAWTSFTPTTTGWASTTFNIGRYTKVGRTVIVQLDISGTSNATTKTVTNLPFTSANITNADVIALYRSVDNTTSANVGSAFLAPNGTTVNLYPTTAHGNWTSSNTATVQGLILIYQSST